MRAVQQFEHRGASEGSNAHRRLSGAPAFDVISLYGEREQMMADADPSRHDDGSVVRFGVSRDTGARRNAEEILRDSDRHLRQMTETIPVMLWSATAVGAIDYCNACMLEYTGFSAEESMGEGWTKLIHPDDVDQAREKWMSCVASGAPYRVRGSDIPRRRSNLPMVRRERAPAAQ